MSLSNSKCSGKDVCTVLFGIQCPHILNHDLHEHFFLLHLLVVSGGRQPNSKVKKHGFNPSFTYFSFRYSLQPGSSTFYFLCCFWMSCSSEVVWVNSNHPTGIKTYMGRSGSSAMKHSFTFSTVTPECEDLVNCMYFYSFQRLLKGEDIGHYF